MADDQGLQIDLRRRFVERGLTRSRMFDVDRMAGDTLDVYRRVAASTSEKRR